MPTCPPSFISLKPTFVLTQYPSPIRFLRKKTAIIPFFWKRNWVPLKHLTKRRKKKHKTHTDTNKYKNTQKKKTCFSQPKGCFAKLRYRPKTGGRPQSSPPTAARWTSRNPPPAGNRDHPCGAPRFLVLGCPGQEVNRSMVRINGLLGGGFKHYLFSPLFGEDDPIWLIFFKGLKPPTRFFHLLINGIYWGYNPFMITIDPNFQRDILVVMGGYVCLANSLVDRLLI